MKKPLGEMRKPEGKTEKSLEEMETTYRFMMHSKADAITLTRAKAIFLDF